MLGISLYAKQLVDGRDRKQLERLARYITRPPLALERLSLRSDGRLELALKSVWKDGTRAILLEPHDLLVRLCASVPAPTPAPRAVLRRAVESSRSARRSHPDGPARAGPVHARCRPGDQQRLPLGPPDADPPRLGRARWGWLIGHVFLADVEHCSRCSGPMRWVEAATTPEAISRLLAKHGLGPRPPPPSRAPPIAEGTAQLCVRALRPLSSSTPATPPDARPLAAGILAPVRARSSLTSVVPNATPDPLHGPSAERRARGRSPLRLSRLVEMLAPPLPVFQLRLDLAQIVRALQRDAGLPVSSPLPEKSEMLLAALKKMEVDSPQIGAPDHDLFDRCPAEWHDEPIEGGIISDQAGRRRVGTV